jgi:hypothetical protein
MASAFLSLGTSVASDLSSVAHELLVAGRIFGRGVVDSLNILHVIKALKKKEIRSLVWNCLFLNLFIFLGSNLLYSYALTPFFNWLTTSESEDISSVVLWIKWIMDFFWMVCALECIFWFLGLYLLQLVSSFIFSITLISFLQFLLFRFPINRTQSSGPVGKFLI